MLDENAYKTLSKWIISEFPTLPTPKVMNTTSMILLQRFSSSLSVVEYTSVAGTSSDLRGFQKKMELLFNVLKELEENAERALTGGSTFLVGRKKGQVDAKIRRVDPLPFKLVGVPLPTTGLEAHDIYVGVLSQLQSILEVCGFIVGDLFIELMQPQHYLLVLREPLVSKTLKSSLLLERTSSSTLPMVLPMNAVRYFGHVEGFGDWSILLSTQAQKDLRDVRNTDGAIFRIVMKKIKWDSVSHCFNWY